MLEGAQDGRSVRLDLHSARHTGFDSGPAAEVCPAGLRGLVKSPTAPLTRAKASRPKPHRTGTEVLKVGPQPSQFGLGPGVGSGGAAMQHSRVSYLTSVCGQQTQLLMASCGLWGRLLPFRPHGTLLDLQGLWTLVCKRRPGRQQIFLPGQPSAGRGQASWRLLPYWPPGLLS